jgi:PhnB protein
MLFNPYLSFDGRCEEAFRHYQAVFGGDITAMIPHEGTPAASQVPPEWREKVLHACLRKDGFMLMGSDAPPGRFEKSQGVAVHAEARTVEEGKRIFQALEEGGTVTMQAGPTFWAVCFGMVTDRFGVKWIINCPLPPDADCSAASGNAAS